MNSVAFVMLVAMLLTPVASAQKPVAELPRVHVDTTWIEPKDGTTWRPHTAAELSTALTNSAPGDVIVLEAGVTYVGAFVLPAKENPKKKWIYIKSSSLAKLPASKRVSPEDAVNMPKIVTPNVAPAFQVNGGANHWRLAGLELTAASNFPSGCPANGKNCMTYFLVGSQARPTPLPDSFVIDRCYIHGSPTQDLQSAVTMNASNYAVVDSHISETHIGGFDSVGLGAYYSPGPFKIVNNYVSSSTENIMFGGAGGASNPYVPSDIEIRNNYLFKPLSWVPLSLARAMVVKNGFELKSAQRVLFDSNIIENVWRQGQEGYAIVLTVRSSQTGDIAVVNDITITNNILKNVGSGFNALGVDDNCADPSHPNCKNAGSQARWYIANNLILFYDPTQPGGTANRMLAIHGGYDRVNKIKGALRDVVFQHNTGVSAVFKPCYTPIFFSSGGQKPPFSNLTNNIWILDNVLCRQPTGDWGLQGTIGLTQYMGSPNAPSQDLNRRFYGNVIFVAPEDRVQAFPPHNLATTKAFRYVNPEKGNYDLLQPKWTETSDGKLAGVDSSLLPREANSMNSNKGRE